MAKTLTNQNDVDVSLTSHPNFGHLLSSDVEPVDREFTGSELLNVMFNSAIFQQQNLMYPKCLFFFLYFLIHHQTPSVENVVGSIVSLWTQSKIP